MEGIIIHLVIHLAEPGEDLFIQKLPTLAISVELNHRDSYEDDWCLPLHPQRRRNSLISGGGSRAAE